MQCWTCFQIYPTNGSQVSTSLQFHADKCGPTLTHEISWGSWICIFPVLWIPGHRLRTSETMFPFKFYTALSIDDSVVSVISVQTPFHQAVQNRWRLDVWYNIMSCLSRLSRFLCFWNGRCWIYSSAFFLVWFLTLNSNTFFVQELALFHSCACSDVVT